MYAQQAPRKTPLSHLPRVLTSLSRNVFSKSVRRTFVTLKEARALRKARSFDGIQPIFARHESSPAHNNGKLAIKAPPPVVPSHLVVLSLANILLDLASTIARSKSAKGQGRVHLQDEDDFCDRFGALIVEPMDKLLERAVRSVFRPFALLSPYPGHRVGPIVLQDESACHCH